MNKTTISLKTKKYESEGDLSWEYNPLHNIIDKSSENHVLSDFDTNELNLDTNHPVEVEVQPSYDGSVNLILNDNNDVPRIVNSAFTVKEGWKYKRVLRNQQKQTNYYSVNEIDSNTRLFRTTNTFLNVFLTDVESGGELRGGNYIFYFKYGDEDYNETDWVGESGIVSIFHGFPSNVADVRGTLMHEKTDHQITLQLNGLDLAFSKLYIYVKRSYADLNGVLMDEYYKIVQPYDIRSSEQAITITGFEQTASVSSDIFNIFYNIYDAVATSTQVQNRLFFGNVKEIVPEHTVLSNCALNIRVECAQEDTVGLVDTNYSASSIRGTEYYNALNIYDKLGYWPGELYRLGVVFIYNNDTLSDVYNLKGCCFSTIGESNSVPGESTVKFKEYDINEIFINGESKYNTRGVFQIPETNVYSSEVKPVGLKMTVGKEVVNKLRRLKIKGLFFVRQPRIPIVLAQGLSIGISDKAYIPVLSRQENGKTVYFTDGILDTKYNLSRNVLNSSDWKATCCALLCQDANLNKPLQSIFDGSQFILKPVCKYNLLSTDRHARNYFATTMLEEVKNETIPTKLAYIAPETSSRVLEGRHFSSKSGSESELVTLRNLCWDYENDVNGERPVDEHTVRGNYSGYVGVVSGSIAENTVYNIYTSSYIGNNVSKRKIQVELRSHDKSAFTAISQRMEIPMLDNGEEYTFDTIYGGDCFTCTTSIKMCYNFLDYNTPLNDKIVKINVAEGLEAGWNNYNNWEVKDMNISDWNAVDIGHYVTYKCLSSFNLGLRCLDDQRTDERSLFGDVRSFYPYAHHTRGIAFKLPESTLFSSGNSATIKATNHFSPNLVPFVKEFFDNRIAFSNIQSVDSFQNNYRVFSGLSYTDVERQYGAIVKLLPLGANLFCVFEHGCGIIPINEKALLSTTTGQSIHLYGSDVVQSQVTVISPDYGSTWEDSIIETPNGIYGVDTFAKKIWRYSADGFAVISDMVVQRFLNDNINLTDYEIDAIVACRNVKTHYNNYKGDVMFTFYNGNKEWNLCYNERLQKWTTRYSWVPGFSANIYNSFISTDKHKAEIFSNVDIDLNNSGLKVVYAELNLTDDDSEYCRYLSRCKFKLQGYDSYTMSGQYGDVDTLYSIRPEITKLSIETGDTIKDITLDSAILYEDIFSDFNADNKTCIWNIPLDREGALVKWVCPWGTFVGVRTAWHETPTTDAGWVDANVNNLFKDWVYYTNEDSEILIQSSLLRKTPNDQSDLIHRINLDFSYNIIQTTVEYEDGEENGERYSKELSKNSISVKESSVSQSVLINPDSIENDLVRKSIDDLRSIKFYTHGRAGYHKNASFVENSSLLKPTYWYGKQEPFEFEFVINSNTGVQKIFDNLAIISNNAEPDSIECTIIGDSYGFGKERILSGSDDKLDFNVEFKVNPDENIVFKTNISKDHVLNQYTLTSCAKLRDLANIKYGRRLGNMHYLEDKWNITLDPIYYKTWSDDKKTSKTTSIKLRDKWMKVRIKYKGDKLAVISAIQSLYTVSFA